MSKKRVYNPHSHHTVDNSFSGQVYRLFQTFQNVPKEELNDFDSFAMKEMQKQAKQYEAEQFRKELKRVAELAGLDIHWEKRKYYKRKDALAEIEKRKRE